MEVPTRTSQLDAGKRDVHCVGLGIAHAVNAFVRGRANDALEKVTGEKRTRVNEARNASRFD